MRVPDTARSVCESRCRQAGHIARRTDNHWGRKVIEQRPRRGRRNVAQPPSESTDNLVKTRSPVGARAFAHKRIRHVSLGRLVSFVETARQTRNKDIVVRTHLIPNLLWRADDVVPQDAAPGA
ncbi:hypothetical protein EVAR_49581_1 [Eumeta japonica]|uniref:Uncharacterized protein n=1 Tax=Eumeta variegata TaxID=151549 RepID=A0A4C1YPG4_EUMVA|nr:hypothetical protein EVAR_49581_1 [Eumeta japonica]